MSNIKLSRLQKDSGKRLSSAAMGFIRSAGSNLVEIKKEGGEYIATPKININISKTPQAKNKLYTFSKTNISHIKLFNGELRDKSYPVLVAALGTAAGVISGGAGLLFTVFQVGVDLNNRSNNVFVRLGDELWFEEEVGMFDGKPTYISSIVLVDPYRSNSAVNALEKGWLLHENRRKLKI